MPSDLTIKMIIPISPPTWAAYLPDAKNDIDSRIAPIVCLSLKADSDEIDGQIVAGELIVEASYVDKEDGFGKFLGYYHSKRAAKEAIEAAVAMLDEEDEEEEEDEDDDDDDEGGQHPEEGESEEDEEDDDEEDEEDDEDE